jgi:hypothetical protein
MRRLLIGVLFLLWPVATGAAERFVVIVSGASGGEKYAVLQHTWTEELVEALTGRFAVPAGNIAVLKEEAEGSSRATAGNLRQLLADLAPRVATDDTLAVFLLGHGTIDGRDAKFNLVGPDLTASEWRDLLTPIRGRLALVNTTESSFPFIEELSRQGRVVITATDSVAQRFATVFPDYFVQVLRSGEGDSDKDGRLSLYEAFAAASAAVRRHYEQRGQLSTERPLLDDDGDRVGRESEAPGGDGAIARAFFLDADRMTTVADPESVALERERERLLRAVEELKTRKPLLAEETYATELEKLLVDLARVATRIRSRS